MVSLAVIVIVMAVSHGSAHVARSIDGLWSITDGKFLDGKGYTGTVRIASADKFYKLNWSVGKATYNGLGFYENRHLYAGWGLVGDIGMISYDVAGDRAVGRRALPGGSTLGSETIVRAR